MSQVSFWMVLTFVLAATTLPSFARPASEASPQTSPALRSLLTSLLRQTLHRRLEGLMVEPGQSRDDEAGDSAADAVIAADADVWDLDEELKETPRQSAHEEDNLDKLPGSWLRAPPLPVALSVSDATAPAADPTSTAADSTPAADNFRTEDYRITDLFTERSTATS